jgi:hypothetical protein
MKVSELIETLGKFDKEIEVCIFDHRKNLHFADCEPTSAGIEPAFQIELISEDVTIPFVAISFINHDYTDDGS